MGATRDPATDQPALIPNDRPPTHELVRADLVRRQAFGEQKYGVALHACNGRNSLQDAYEESLDRTVYLYLKNALIEREEMERELAFATRTVGALVKLITDSDTPIGGALRLTGRRYTMDEVMGMVAEQLAQDDARQADPATGTPYDAERHTAEEFARMQSLALEAGAGC